MSKRLRQRAMPPPRRPGRMGGFTLVEAIVVISLTGILAAIVAVFIVKPVEGYFDSVRRAELSDAADNALRRVAREVRTALPNSLRQPDDQCIEFLPVAGGGRYATHGSDALDFVGTGASADSAFEVYGYSAADDASPVAGQSLAVYNLGLPDASAYNDPTQASSTRGLIAAGSSVSAATGSGSIQFSRKRFPFESPGRRFQLLAADASGASHSVVYACVGAGLAGGQGQGGLYRYTRSLPAAAALSALASCPASAPAGAQLLVGEVESCSLDYTAVPSTAATFQRFGLLEMRLALTRAQESVRLYHEVHVSNVP